MDLLSLKLMALKGAWRKYQVRRTNPKFKSLAEKIWKRDDYHCRYCGFNSKEYLEVVNQDLNYDNNTIDNLVSACTFCAQCFFIESISLDEHFGGRIIFLPEISQANLNNFCRVLFCAMDKDSAYKGKLQAIYLSLKDRSKVIESCFGPNSSDPSVFGQGLIDTYLNKEQLSHKLLEQLRLLPTRLQFRSQIDYWKKTVFANVPL